MIKKLILATVFIPLSSLCYSFDLGISTSGKDVSLDFWSSATNQTNWGWYARLLFDFETYGNDEMVTVCNDGSISGSTGSGTCSGHGGISGAKLAEFDRLGIIVGPSYWVFDRVQFHAGVLVGLYSSDVDIGETRELDYTELGIDLGISIQPLKNSNLKFVLSHETDQASTSIGVRFSI